MVLNRAVGPVGRAGHPGTLCAVLACILLHTCRTRVLPNASAPRSYALTTARHASLIWRKRCWWLFTSVLARVLVVVHVCAGSSAGTRYESSAVVVCRGGGGKRKTSARTARRTRQSHSTGRDSARGDDGLARMHARTRSQDGGVRTGHTGTTDGHTDTRTGHVARSLLGQLLSSHGDLSLSDRHSGHDPPRLRARRRSARHRYLQGCKVQRLAPLGSRSPLRLGLSAARVRRGVRRDTG